MVELRAACARGTAAIYGGKAPPGTLASARAVKRYRGLDGRTDPALGTHVSQLEFDGAFAQTQDFANIGGGLAPRSPVEAFEFAVG